MTTQDGTSDAIVVTDAPVVPGLRFRLFHGPAATIRRCWPC